MERSYRIDSDSSTVVCDTTANRADVDALVDSIAWRRNELSRVGLQDADAVLAVRSLVTLDDLLNAGDSAAEHILLTLTRPQARMLCEIAGAYVAERDIESYQPPEERGRIALLRALAGPLMDTCCELAAAEDEVRERLLTV